MHDARDAIVIGSGIGGLTVAGLLSGVAGHKVLVLERHTEPGGLTHVFRRDGASWDVGLHYVGELGPKSEFRALFDYLSGGELRWNRLPDAFERFVYPGLDLTVPSDARAYEARLAERFPDERRAIRAYFRDIRLAQRWLRLGFARVSVPAPLEPSLWFVQRLFAGWATQTTKNYLERRFRSPVLRALVASQWGDYGLPPARSAFAIHAQIVAHYLEGAWFPEGGASRIARSFEKGIEANGGAILVGQEVVEILVEQGRAAGVRVVDRRGPEPSEKIYRAPVVVSNVGAANTVGRLLPTTGETGAKTAALRDLVTRLGHGLSAVTLYLRLRHSAATLGVRGENYWINTGLAHDDAPRPAAPGEEWRPRQAYVSFPSLKSGDDRFHTAEIISLVEPDVFAPWADRPMGARGEDYARFKDRIAADLLHLADSTIPGLRDLVLYSELSTPLTVQHFTAHPEGAFYGLPASPERHRSRLLGPRTGIEGLYLSGEDAGCLGIVGAMMGGAVAAYAALGPRGYPMVKAAVRSGRAKRSASRLPDHKRLAKLVAKTQLTPSVFQLDFELDREVGGFAPGQFARLHVGNDEWRDYSIAGLDRRAVCFLISTRTGGHGSRFVEEVAPGAQTEIELPLGRYTLEVNDRPKLFVATGTGLAPFLPMFRHLHATNGLANALLLFGCATNQDDLTRSQAPLPAQVIRCISRETPTDGARGGRVTQALADLAFEPARTDAYVCGSAAMVADARRILEGRGVRTIRTEAF